MKLICPDCGKQYESGKFCLECGAKLQEVAPELVCPSCGYKAKTGKFCPECGTKLTEQSAAPTAEANNAPEERKFNEKDERFAKYYNKKGFPRTIPQEERAVAIEELTPFADQNVAEAKMLLGNIMCYQGDIQGVRLIKEAELAGDKFAYYLMAIGYLSGFDDIVELDHDEAEKRLLECYQEYEDEEIAGMLAQLYTFSDEKCDYKKALQYATIAAENDDKDGYATLGALYHNGWGVEKNQELALENYKMAAALGDETALNQIGYIFMGSDDYEANPEQAFFWFNEAAQKGSDVGMFNLAYCYQNGIGVKQDEEIAAEWYKKAAGLGYVDAMCSLGDYYQSTLYDFNKSRAWYLKAAEMGHAEAQNKLSVLYADDLEPNYEEAIKWCKEAMQQNHPCAYRNYAIWLWNGTGVKEDREEAMKMMQKAISLGHPNAEDELKEMKEAPDNVQECKKEESQSVSQNEWYVPDGLTVLHQTTLPNTSRKWRDSIEVVHLPESLKDIDIYVEDEDDDEHCFGLSIFPNLLKVIIPKGAMDRFVEMDPWLSDKWETVWNDDGTHVFPDFLSAINCVEKPYCTTPYYRTVVTGRIVGAKNNIIISPKCVEIQKEAFQFDKNLESIYMFDSVKLIGEKAFYCCKNLKSVRLSKNVVTLQKDLFHGCDSLKELVIPEGVSVIEEAAFVSCKSLESITLPSTITRIDKGGAFGFNPFQLCNSLKKIIVPKGTIAHFQSLLKGFSGNPSQYLVEN